MADTSVAITAGTGTQVDTRTEATNGNHRQVVVLGDPSVNAGVAPVDATNGLTINLLGVAGNTLSTGNGTAGNGCPRVTIASDNTAFPVKGGGTAGAADAAVLSVQGIAAMTPLAVVGKSIVASANFTRPADTTAYAVGDLVANSTTAGSVVVMSHTIGRVNDGYVTIRRSRLQKSTTSITNALFRQHFYRSAVTATNGDNGAWLTTLSGYIGWIDITVDKVFSDGAMGIGVPTVGSELIAPCVSGAMTIFSLLEARGAYTPGNAEVFTDYLEVLQD